MGEVTGPIRTLPGAAHDLPDGSMCDQHPDRPAVVRLQGETDSFGSELWDMCRECLDEHRKAMADPDARTGTCGWCKGHATDLRPARDYDEGSYGRVYDVCGACIKRVNDEAECELEANGHYDAWDDWDDEPEPEQPYEDEPE